MRIEQQFHAYVAGHDLVASSVTLDRSDQELMDRLSDISGSLAPGEACPPYLTGYPLPSGQSYVLARTWYDDSAPRAGCVLTHSLLLPMKPWGDAENLSTILGKFTPFKRDLRRRRLEPLELTLDEPAPPLKRTPAHVTLAEAMFLEERAPIVAFGFEDPELVSIRLLEAMWPALRTSFAVSTFALKPRSVGGRFFDLVFAPTSSSPRFAGWAGRRIDASLQAPPQGRHRWSEGLSRSIFEAVPPRLAPADSLGILKRDAAGDVGRLRLALLWEDLKQREAESATAVLGMLDVIASIGLDERERLHLSEPLAIGAAERAGEEMTTVDGLRFLKLLLGKLPPRRPHGRTLGAIYSAARSLASADPQAAIKFVPFDGSSFLGGRTLVRGIGDALAALKPRALLELLVDSPQDAVTHLLAASPGLSRAAILCRESVSESWWPVLASVLILSAERERRRFLRRMVPLLHRSAHAGLIPPLLRGVTDSQFAIAAVTLLINAESDAVPAFEQALLDALPASGRESLREALLSLPPNVDLPSKLFLSTLPSASAALDVLTLHPRIGVAQRPGLVADFLAGVSDSDLAGVAAKSRGGLSAALSVLTAHSPPTAPREIIRVLRLLPATADAAGVAANVIDSLERSEALRLLSDLLPRLLSECELEALGSVARLLCCRGAVGVSGKLGSMRLLDMFVPYRRNAFDARRQSAVLATAAAAAAFVRPLTSERLDELALRLVDRLSGELTVAGFEAWAGLLEEARSGRSPVAARALAISLRHALDRRPRGASAIVRASFPVVYGLACADESSSEIDSLFSFFDWDRAKTLRAQLVGAYLRSDWPPGDLMVSSEASGIGRKVLKRLLRDYEGPRYILRMKADLDQRDGPEVRAARAEISRFEHEPPDRGEWD